MKCKCEEVESFRVFKILTKIAGYIGLIQSIIWTALMIFLIYLYFSEIKLTNDNIKLSRILAATFIEVYLIGFCNTFDLEECPFGRLRELTLLSNNGVIKCIWAYLIISFLWFLSSITLFKCIKKSSIRRSAFYVFVWIVIAFTIAAFDICMGIIFGIDLNCFLNFSKNFDTKKFEFTKLAILSAEAVSFFIMMICFRGIVLLLINISFIVNLFFKTLAMLNTCSTMNNEDFQSLHSDTTLGRRPVNILKDSFKQHSSVNMTPLHRANQMSLNVLHQRRSKWLNISRQPSNENLSLPELPYEQPRRKQINQSSVPESEYNGPAWQMHFGYPRPKDIGFIRPSAANNSNGS